MRLINSLILGYFQHHAITFRHLLSEQTTNSPNHRFLSILHYLLIVTIILHNVYSSDHRCRQRYCRVVAAY
jgi:hypothetical protein